MNNASPSEHAILFADVVGSNGTYVTIHLQPLAYLRREKLPIWGSGRIGIGRPVMSTDVHYITFTCE